MSRHILPTEHYLYDDASSYEYGTIVEHIDTTLTSDLDHLKEDDKMNLTIARYVDDSGKAYKYAIVEYTDVSNRKNIETYPIYVTKEDVAYVSKNTQPSNFALGLLEHYREKEAQNIVDQVLANVR